MGQGTDFNRLHCQQTTEQGKSPEQRGGAVDQLEQLVTTGQIDSHPRKDPSQPKLLKAAYEVGKTQSGCGEKMEIFLLH